MKKGKSADNFLFSLSETTITTLLECPVKSLGRIFDRTLRDTNAVQAAVDDLELWLAKGDKSGLPNRFKAWVHQHVALPRVLWSLFVHDSPIMEAMERKIKSYPRRLSGLPRSLSNAALYGISNALQHPFKGLTEEFVASGTREEMLYRDSKDPEVAAASIEIRTRRKWSAEKELEKTEERLRLKALMGTVAIGRAGQGYFTSIQIHKAKSNQSRNLIQEEVCANVEEERRGKMVGLSQ